MRLTRPSLSATAREPTPLVRYHAFHFEAFILFLPHILKEGAGQHRKAEFDVEDDEEHAQKAAPDTHFQELSGVSHDGLRQEDGFRYLDEFSTESDIFQNTLAGKPTELLEQRAADKEGLIAVDDPAANAPKIIQERDQLEPPIVAGELVHEPPGLNGLVRLHLVQPMNSPDDQAVSEGLERFIQSREEDGHQPSSHRRIRPYLDRLMPFFSVFFAFQGPFLARASNLLNFLDQFRLGSGTCLADGF